MRPFAISRSLYIVSPVYDWVGFIGAPLIAMAIGIGVGFRWIPDEYVSVGYFKGRYWELIVLILMTQCHLFMTVVRAYGNAKIFRAFKWRLLLAPPLIFLFGFFSQTVLIVQLVLNTWWDAYHSACQTFGFTRMYDAKIGDALAEMRRLDRVLCVLLYMGPIIGGATLIQHLSTFEHFSLLGLFFLADVPAVAGRVSTGLVVAVLGFAALFIPYYLFRLVQHSKKQLVSPLKGLMLVITAVVSICAWGFNSFGMAFIIANFFHAWQYYAMLYWSEKKALTQRLFSPKFSTIGVIALFTVITVAFGGFVVFVLDPANASRLGICFLATVATCHFWFDGFIWSVKKSHI